MFDVHRTAAAAYSVIAEGDAFRFLAANQACLDLTGFAPTSFPGLTPHDCFPLPVAEQIVDRYRACRDTRQAVSYVSEVEAATGTRRWRTTLFPVIDGDGQVASLFGVLADAGEPVSDLRALGFDQSALAIGVVDGGFWVYDYATSLFETSTPLAELIAGPGHATLNLAEYISHIHVDDFRSGTLFGPRDDRASADYRVITYDGRTRWLRSRRRIIRDEAGIAQRAVSLVSDITDEKTRLLTLETEAATDTLTSLKNRRTFERATAQALRDARASGDDVGILLIDLDGFKAVNDRHGHRIGDELLRKVARRLARHVRKQELLARIGGDEFAVLVRRNAADTGRASATRIQRGFAKPFALNDLTLFVGVSTGYGIAAGGQGTVDDLLERADRDLYLVKAERGRLSA